jgi:hypothetical protein
MLDRLEFVAQGDPFLLAIEGKIQNKIRSSGDDPSSIKAQKIHQYFIKQFFTSFSKKYLSCDASETVKIRASLKAAANILPTLQMGECLLGISKDDPCKRSWHIFLASVIESFPEIAPYFTV